MSRCTPTPPAVAFAGVGNELLNAGVGDKDDAAAEANDCGAGDEGECRVRGACYDLRCVRGLDFGEIMKQSSMKEGILRGKPA